MQVQYFPVFFSCLHIIGIINTYIVSRVSLNEFRIPCLRKPEVIYHGPLSRKIFRYLGTNEICCINETCQYSISSSVAPLLSFGGIQPEVTIVSVGEK